MGNFNTGGVRHLASVAKVRKRQHPEVIYVAVLRPRKHNGQQT